MKRFVLSLATLSLAFSSNASVPAAAGSASYSVDDVLSAPFVDGLAASPRRDALVWTVHERGARNVAVWKAGAAREVTHVADDDGQEIDAAALTPNDDAVVYARGGAGQDGGGDNPNPIAPAKRAARRILLTSLAGSGTTIELGMGREPVVSPRGDRVAWIDETSQLRVAAIASKDGGATWTAGTSDEPFKVRGTVDGPLWSPDGTRIAFTNDRGTHAFVGIYTFGSPLVTFAAPGFGTDGSPAWSADGAKLAFVRQPSLPDDVSPYDDPAPLPPWSIVVVDGRTGLGAVAWRAPRGRGSEFSIADGVQPLWWSQSGDLAFVWERDGWRHLYALGGASGSPRLLTPGSFDIEQIAASADGASLLYTSNEGDLDARHVWRVPFRDGARVRVTSGPTNQWSPVDLARGIPAYVDASYASPGEVTLANGGTALVAAPTPATFPTSFVEPKAIVFRAPDGLRIHAQLFVPKGSGRHPALIFVHGGPERQMLTTFHYFEAYTNFFEIEQYLTNRGFEVLSVNYRSGIMYGHDFYEAPKRGWLGASEYQDVLAGARVLGARSEVDPRRLGIFGLSYGGYLTALALARNSDVFSVGADQSGVHDWRALFDSSFGHAVGTPQQRAVAYASSPVASLAAWRSPVYLSQGDDDRNVPFAQGIELAMGLGARGVTVATSVVPDELHEYTVYAHELARFTETVDFLSAHLRP